MSSMFQQRHFEAIAEVIQEIKRYNRDRYDAGGVDCNQVILYAERQIADLFARSNGMFDRGRFERACEIGANVKARTR